jgi:3-hydroxyacyl-[acyl-carrier-protein] dehydratase
MEMLTAVTLLDRDRKLCVGYKDVRPDEFWVRGHMPGSPLLPGVLMLEAAAQLGAIYCIHGQFFDGHDFIGLGGIDEVRYRAIVRPGDRLWLIGSVGRMNRRMTAFYFQGFVDAQMTFEAKIIGVPMNYDMVDAKSPP